MTVHLEWPPEIVGRLIEEARKKGLTLDAFLLQTVLQQTPRDGDPEEAARRRAREEAGRNIRELRGGNILGPELTIRDLVKQGRCF